MKNFSVVALWAIMLVLPRISAGQIPINTFTTLSNIVVAGGTSSSVINSHSASVNGITPSTNYTVSYNNTGNVKVVDFTYSGKSYVRYSTFDTIFFRRVANAWETTGGNKQHIYCQGNATVDNVNHTMPFPVAYPQVTNHAYMERAMKEGFINRGSDNIFNNDAGSDLTFNNIERVDFVYKAGISAIVPSSAGFLIAERGGNDAFKIAAITSVDSDGNPTSFGTPILVSTISYGATIMSAPTYVMRKDPADNTLRPFSLVSSQNIKAVFVRLSDLGVAAYEEVYGYALMGSDVIASTSAQVLNYTSSFYYPRISSSLTGGMDLASAPGIFHTDQVLSVRFLDVKAQARDCEQMLQWKDEEYEQVKEYQLEKSFNSEDFEKINSIAPGSSVNYSYTDKNFNANSYYRVKALLKNGTFYYSAVLYAKCNCSSFTVSLFPNPAQDYLTISFHDAAANRRVAVFSADGKEYGKWTVATNSKLLQLDIRDLPRGNYFVRISGTDGQQKTHQFVKQ